MGSPLGPTQGNLLLYYHEKKKWLNKWAAEFQTVLQAIFG